MLSFTRTIGKGQFGEVYQGLWHPKAQGEGSPQLPVAIKMLHGEFPASIITSVLMKCDAGTQKN